MSKASAYHLVVQTGTLIKLPALFYSGSGRALSFVLALLFATVSVGAQTKISSLTNVIEGHAVGGVTVDLVGNIYVADFGEYVWKITPEGKRDVFASGLYGASGNAIDNEGNLLQSNFYADSITKISFDREGNLYVVNFRDKKMLKVDPKGFVAPFATISKKGLGHLCFKEDRFYVTAFESHEIYEVTLDGTVKRILGDGNRGVVDGAAAKARLSFPNGIAIHPWARRLYINEVANESTSSLPPRTIVREIILEKEKS